MGCLLIAFCVMGGRLAFLLLWAFGAMAGIFQTWYWPTLGFFFMPYTTMAYVGAKHWCESTGSGWGLALMILGVLFDLGSYGSSATPKNKR